MSFNLNDQYVYEFEEQRRNLERVVEESRTLGREVTRLEAALGLCHERLQAQDEIVTDLQEKLQTAQAALAAKDEELQAAQASVRSRDKKRRADQDVVASRAALAAKDKEVQAALAALAAKDKELQTALDTIAVKEGKIQRLRVGRSAELRKLKTLHDEELAQKEQARRKLGLDLTAIRLHVVGLEATIDEERSLEANLERVNYLPLRMRLLALGFDVVALVIASKYLGKWEPEWSRGSLFSVFAVRLMLIFSLRTFFSPGRILLGISPRSIGPQLRPSGLAGPGARFFCGLLHYGPMIWAVHGVTKNPRLLADLTTIGSRLMNPSKPGPGGITILKDLYGSYHDSSAFMVLTMALAWWVVLLLTVLLSRWIHRDTPYFWNTTLIEWIGKVGYQRFPWPRRTSEVAP